MMTLSMSLDMNLMPVQPIVGSDLSGFYIGCPCPAVTCLIASVVLLDFVNMSVLDIWKWIGLICDLMHWLASKGCQGYVLLQRVGKWCKTPSPEQGGKLLGLLLTGSTGQHMAGRNGLA
jgi:hypothetical protein